MAKRIVVFDNSDSSPAVITRRKKTAEAAKPEATKAMKPEKEQQGAVRKKATPAAPAPKKAAPAKPGAKKDAASAGVVFRNRYLAELRECLGNIEQALEDESRPDRNYYLIRKDFVSQLIDQVENDNGDNLGEFTQLSEPFFWDEFARLAWLISTGPKNETAKGPRVAPTWRRAGGNLARLLMRNLNKVRSMRDNFVLKTPPLNRNGVIFSVNGALLYLNKDIDADPDNEKLRNLREIYERMYQKSGLKAKAEKLADYIATQRETRPDFSIWRNEDTVKYLLDQRKNPEKEEE